MKLFSQPLGSYFRNVRAGLALLVLVGVVRFLMQPLLGIPPERGSTLTSVTWLLLILILVYSFLVGRRGGGFGDVVGNVFALASTTALIVVLAIAVDDFGGIDTYYTSPQHGGSLNPWVHMGGHVVAALILTVVGSLVGGLVSLAGRSMKSV